MTAAVYTRHTIRAADGSLLTAVRREDGRVELSLSQAPDRAVSVRFTPDRIDELARFLTES